MNDHKQKVDIRFAVSLVGGVVAILVYFWAIPFGVDAIFDHYTDLKALPLAIYVSYCWFVTCTYALFVVLAWIFFAGDSKW